MATWNSTIRLPKSTFPPRSAAALRPNYLKRCTDDLYAWQRSRAHRPNAQNAFVLHDGPPYANGSVHIGHALNKLLKDITNRYQLQQGRRIEYVPGWDCHGLPIEQKALQGWKREHGNRDATLGAVEIRAVARKLALATVEEQKAGFQEWAVMGDWDHAWKTLDPAFELRQLRVFQNMVAKGLIYRKFRPVYWSPSSRTALAEAELEYNPEHVSTAAFVKLPLRTLPDVLSEYRGQNAEPVHAVIWTTTPWTLLANRAMAVHSELDYALVRSRTHGLLLLGQSRVGAVSKAIGKEGTFETLATVPGSQLVGCGYDIPGTGRTGSCPIMHADFVDAESGSGIVHMAPGHGMEDYRLCQQRGIEAFAPVDNQGCYTADAFPSSPKRFHGFEVLGTGSEVLLHFLREQKLLLGTQKYTHKYPYDWRSKKPVIIRATQQWFANVESIREASLRALDNVKFVPGGGKERLTSFLLNRSEWCISRQRAWGVPIPALYRKADGTAILTPESIEHVISVFRSRGTDAWWSDAESEPAWVPSSLGNPSDYVRGKDTMDVWFDSGTSWTELGKTAGFGAPSQADVYLEGSDQHRGWFQSSLLTKIATQDSNPVAPAVAPFKTLVTHGFTLDEQGRKMSKSEGNVVAPSHIMEATYQISLRNKKKGKAVLENRDTELGNGAGPDALRLWVGGCDFTKDVVVGDRIVKSVVQSLSKLRNTFKFLLGALDDYQPTTIPFSAFDGVDRMAILQLQRFIAEAQAAYQRYEYHHVVLGLNQYVNAELSSGYLRSIKDRLYVDAPKSTSRLHARTVLWEITQNLLRVMSPIVPLLVEEVCDHLPSQLSFHPVKSEASSPGSIVAGPWADPELESDMPYLSAVKVQAETAMELARAEHGAGSSLQFFVAVELPAGTEAGTQQRQTPAADAVRRHQGDLADLLVVSQANVYSPPGGRPAALADAPWAYSRPCKFGDEVVVVHVYPAPLGKCERCWKYTVPKEPELEASLCVRCLGVLDGLRDEHADLFVGRPKTDEAAARCRKVSRMEKH